MDDKRNMITAILLSVAILIGWNFVSEKFFPTPDKPDVTRTVAGPNGAAPAAVPGQPAALPAPGVPAATAAQAIRPIEAVLGEGNRIPIDTPAIKGSINLVGARIDDITLGKYRQTIKKDSPRSACSPSPAPRPPISRASAGRRRASSFRARPRSGPQRVPG